MTVRPIIDAGPALSFLAINKERLLLATTGPISTPETVRNEVLSKSAKDRRFAPVERVWNKIPSKFLDVLPDDPTPELVAALSRISQQPWNQRLATAKDLGETMVVAHAVVHAEAGHQVTVIIDDQGGAALATTEIWRLDRLRKMGKPVGIVKLLRSSDLG
ncbi:PIN domain-containing protein [Rhodococcus erythropolis]|uniref:PIN domain-containing protein n=1 Tax=Rhodococcus erythropolis TaxID=1833 RepID=UPI00294A34D1|nr:PIN domain-containing protein [Rhodococcus erythropolis]MDV6277940.1 PIN domain-containing protein [Rhodococcus erythropolis]